MSKNPVKDVFNLWQIDFLEHDDFCGEYEFPHVNGSVVIPSGLVAFSKCEEALDDIRMLSLIQNYAVHFYEYDEKFIFYLENKTELIRKLKIFHRYKCVILPDFSIYRDMPLAMQIFQIYKSRAVGAFLEHNGIQVIPNVRWGDERSYKFAFDGINPYGIVSVGVQGAYRNNENAYYFEKGFLKMLDILSPDTLLCYGSISEGLQNECILRKIKVISFVTEIERRTASCSTLDDQLKLF